MTELWTQQCDRILVDANGYVWREFTKGVAPHQPKTWYSMPPCNPDNSPIPLPVTYYVRDDLLEAQRQLAIAIQDDHRAVFVACLELTKLLRRWSEGFQNETVTISLLAPDGVFVWTVSELLERIASMMGESMIATSRGEGSGDVAASPDPISEPADVASDELHTAQADARALYVVSMQQANDVAGMRRALEFYADHSTYVEGFIDADFGAKARQVLKMIGEQ